MTDIDDPILRGQHQAHAALRALAGLPAPAPSVIRAERLRTRCHRVLDTRRRQRALPKRSSRHGRALDAACFLVAGIYLAGAISETVWLLN
jgi:hypothetical protein